MLRRMQKIGLSSFGLALLVLAGIFMVRLDSKKDHSSKPVCLKVGIPSVYKAYDPSQVTTTSHAFILNAIMGRLVSIGANNELFTGLALKWRVLNGDRSFEMTLNPNARFSDGSHITARDVIASLKRAIVFGASHIKLSTKILGAERVKDIADIDLEIDGLKEINSSTVLITLNGPEPQFLYSLEFYELGILRESDARMGLNQISFDVTSGAFFIENSSKSSTVRLKANPYFYQTRGTAGHCFEVRAFGNEDDALLAMKSGQLDLLEFGVMLNPEFQSLLVSKEWKATINNSQGLLYFIANGSSPHMSSSQLRRSFRHLVQISDLIPFGKNSVFMPANQFLTTDHLGYLSKRETDEIDGELKPENSYPETLRLLVPKSVGAAYLSRLQATLEAASGSKIEIIQPSLLAPEIEKGSYDALLMITGMGEKATNILIELHFLPQLNLYRFEDERIQSLVREGASVEDLQARGAIYRRLSKLLLEESYIAPIAYFKWPVFHRSDLRFDRHHEFVYNTELWDLSWTD